MTEGMRAAWDAEAIRFDDEPDHGLRDPGVREAWGNLFRQILPSPPARVLDVGCGTGSVSVLLAELGYEVLGLDLSPRMVERAEQKAARHGVPVRFKVGDAASAEVEGAFDVVLCRHVLWALPDVPAVLKRWTALLDDGGLLVLIEGFWRTGAGLHADDVLPLLGRETIASLRNLSCYADLWGGPVSDERFVITAHFRRD